MSRSRITTEDIVFPSTLGEMLREDFLEPLEMTSGDLAAKLLCDETDLTAVINDERPLDPELDLRLSRYFGLSNGFLLGYQWHRELRVRRHQISEALDRIVPRLVQHAA